VTVDPVDIVRLTRSLVDIDSTTGREGECGRWLADYLRGRNWSVEEQRVDDTRFNVIADVPGAPKRETREDGDRAPRTAHLAPRTPHPAPRVTFSTHFDCVPSFFPSRIEGDRLFGRGSCDAKGILAAQVSAAEQLRRDGETRVGLVFVVGEERGSDGARVADAAAPGAGPRFLINGEPTDNRLGLATRGILRLRLRASGRAAHSSFPELGESAIDKLIDALIELRGIPMPSDPILGKTHYTVGLINGGVAPNVVSASAEAEVMFRTTSDAEGVRKAVTPLETRVAIEHVLEVPPVRLKTAPGFETAVFPYTTDIPFLSGWGEPLLFGPGSIHVAHTADEWVSVAELKAAADHYVTLAKTLLAQG
jgi:acetylornithine deacetylase